MRGGNNTRVVAILQSVRELPRKDLELLCVSLLALSARETGYPQLSRDLVSAEQEKSALSSFFSWVKRVHAKSRCN